MDSRRKVEREGKDGSVAHWFWWFSCVARSREPKSVSSVHARRCPPWPAKPACEIFRCGAARLKPGKRVIGGASRQLSAFSLAGTVLSLPGPAPPCVALPLPAWHMLHGPAVVPSPRPSANTDRTPQPSPRPWERPPHFAAHPGICRTAVVVRPRRSVNRHVTSMTRVWPHPTHASMAWGDMTF